MGAWGAGVFANDAALDLRADLRELLAVGLDLPTALARAEAARGPGEQNRFEGPDWMAAALSAWRLGRLEPWLHDRAVAAIDAELAAGLPEWEGAPLRRARERELAQLRARLATPQRAPTKLRLEPLDRSPFAAGDIVRFTGADGREAAFWAMASKTRTSISGRTSVTTPFVLLAFGDPLLAPVDALVAAGPMILRSPERRWLQRFHLDRPQGARPPRFVRIGNAPFAPELVAGSSQLVTVKPIRNQERTGADAFFAGWWQRGRAESPQLDALEALAALGPDPDGRARTWEGSVSDGARRVAIVVAQALVAGDPGPADAILPRVGTHAAGTPDERLVAVQLLDPLLSAATHPELAFTRADVLERVGGAAAEVVAEIDAAWAPVRIRTDWTPDYERPVERWRWWTSNRAHADGGYQLAQLPTLRGPKRFVSSWPIAAIVHRDRGASGP